MRGGEAANSRQVVLRGARETEDPEEKRQLRMVAKALAHGLERAEHCATVDALRGYEGDAARQYFAVFDTMVKDRPEAFRMHGRSRRPPLDRMNALLSFLYTMVLGDCVAAVEGVGLDPQVGFLHVLRPGRPALGLDLMEELRPVLADRLALTLLNLHQVRPEHFEERPGGAVFLNDAGRREVITAYQKRKQDETMHRVLNQKIPYGLIPHIQARLLARHLREEMPEYLPYIQK